MIRHFTLIIDSIVILLALLITLKSSASQDDGEIEFEMSNSVKLNLEIEAMPDYVDRAPAAKAPENSPVAPKDSANATSSNQEVIHKRKATLNFEDELVEGSTQKPELFYLFQKKNFNYKRLIKLRENFLPEMRKTAEDIQRVRGAN